jgi:UDP-4-amino-4,6-dideoxy-N-acetyl-beta-L-altrosamine transaminase
MIELPYSKQYIDKKDIKSVTKALNNKFLTQGPLVEKFEKKIANYVGSKYAVAVSSCSAGLHLACLVINKKNKKSMITSPITFVSTASAILHAKKKVIFCDISKNEVNIDPEKIQEILNKNQSVEGVIPVHMAGKACDMKKIKEICDAHKVYIIEDAAHALGSQYFCGSFVGSCKYSLMTVFSFHPLKTITTGEGGVITTNNKKIYIKLKNLRSHGIVKNVKKSVSKNLPWFYEMRNLGFHYRLTDIQCALGISQLEKIDTFIKSRTSIVKKYRNYFKDHLYCKPAQKLSLRQNSNHLFILRINFKKLKKTREKLMNFLKKKNIFTQVHYIPIPMHPYFKKLGYNIKNFPNAQKYYQEALSIPVFHNLKNSSQIKIIKIIKKFLSI